MYLAQTLRRSAQLQGDAGLVEGDYRLSWSAFGIGWPGSRAVCCAG